MGSYMAYTIGSQKYTHPFCIPHLGKSGEGVFARIFNSSCAYAPPFVPLSRQLPLLSGRTAALMNMYYRKSAALVFTLSQEASKQLASSVVTGDDLVQVRIPSASNIKLGGGQRMRLCIVFCVYVFLNTVNDRAKPKAH